MSRGLFITGTGTDTGKTYVSALLVKKIKEAGYASGYYKAALSGADSIAESDAGYVKKFAGIPQEEHTLVSYLYKSPVSPHLAAQIEGGPADPEKIRSDYRQVCAVHDFVTVEGSGGILCPVRWDEQKKILLEDIVKMLELPVLIVADAGLGTINATVLTAEHLRSRGIKINGIVLNHYKKGLMVDDNIKMIETLTGVPVIACVTDGAADLTVDPENILFLYE